MNSLEFIEKQILYVKENIQYHKNLLTTVEDDESIEIIKSTIRLLEPDLQTLQQIKVELEIMELIENGWSSMEQTLSGEKIIKFQKLNLDDWFKVWKTLEEIGLKKALEVGNNHEETR